MPLSVQPRPRRRADEFRFIETLRRRFGHTGRFVRGIGDDAAAVRLAAGQVLLITTDLLVEQVHFDFTTATFEDVGYKAAVANLSDIAAMGGRPEYLVVAIAIPQSRTQGEIIELYRGMMLACRQFGVELVGGDTSASPHSLFLCITMTGSVRSDWALTRDGARVGDFVYVTGALGDSLAGLDLLTQTRVDGPTLKQLNRQLGPRAVQYLIDRHLRPTPRIKEAQWLSRYRLATAAIDLSDGLSGDLVHLCEQSGVGAEIEISALPMSRACRAYASFRRLDPSRMALKGGEDYELLFTVAPKKATALERLAKRMRLRWTRIGTILSKSSGRRIRTKTGAVQRLPVLSYRHF